MTGSSLSANPGPNRTPDPGPSRDRNRVWNRRCRRIDRARATGAGAAALVLFGVGASFGLSRWDGLLVLNGKVVQDGAVGLSLLVAALLVYLAGMPWWATSDRSGPAVGRRRRVGRAGLVVLLVPTGAWNLLLLGFEQSPRHTMVEPTGPGECRVLLRATFWAMDPYSIAWRSYTMAGRWGAARPVTTGSMGSTSSDLEHYRSFSPDHYRLTWHGRSGVLVSTRVSVEVAERLTRPDEPPPMSSATRTPVQCPEGGCPGRIRTAGGNRRR